MHPVKRLFVDRVDEMMEGHEDADRENEVGITFRAWWLQLEIAVWRLSGLGASDLPDFCSWDAWDACESPEAKARDLLASEGFPLTNGEGQE